MVPRPPQRSAVGEDARCLTLSRAHYSVHDALREPACKVSMKAPRRCRWDGRATVTAPQAGPAPQAARGPASVRLAPPSGSTQAGATLRSDACGQRRFRQRSRDNLPAPGVLAANQPHIGLVDERRRLEGVIAPLLGHLPTSQFPQFVEEKRSEIPHGLGIARLVRPQGLSALRVPRDPDDF